MRDALKKTIRWMWSISCAGLPLAEEDYAVRNWVVSKKTTETTAVQETK